MNPLRLAIALLVLIASLAQGATLSGVRIDEVRWAFDGQVLPGMFQPLSLLVSNPSAQPFQGVMVLERRNGMSRTGARMVEQVYLSPGAQRWVQFYPYVADDWGDWRVSWGEAAGQELMLDKPRTNNDLAVVLLTEDDRVAAPGSARGSVAAFPESAFPPSVTATDALGVVLLDHEPRWEPVRRQAFLDWLHRGGVAVILRERSGKFPAFSQELAVLNAPADELRVGAGWMLRRPITRRDITPALRDQLNLFPNIRKQKIGEHWVGGGPGDMILPTLKRFTQPKHNWALIFTLSVVYLLIIGPLNWLIGRKANYRVTLALLLGAVVCFGSIFFYTGRRGFGEADQIHSFGYARPLGNGAYDLTQWTNLFVTQGNTYAITHDCPFNLYSTYFQIESVHGMIDSGASGSFVVDVPMYASRDFVHRGRVSGGGGGPLIESFERLPSDFLRKSYSTPVPTGRLRCWRVGSCRASLHTPSPSVAKERLPPAAARDRPLRS